MGDEIAGSVAVSQGGSPVALAFNSAAGSYQENVSGLTGGGKSNYTLAPGGNTAGTLTINPKALTWSIANAASTYGTLASPGAATLTGVVVGDEIAGSVAVSQGGSPVSLVFNSAAGTYQENVTGLTGSGTANYVLAPGGNTEGTLTINQKALNWSVADATAVFGTRPPINSAILTGLIAGDTVTAAVRVFNRTSAITPATSTAVGSYQEKATALVGAAAFNYVLASTGNAAGTLTIEPRPTPIIPAPQTGGIVLASFSVPSVTQNALPPSLSTAPDIFSAVPSVPAPSVPALSNPALSNPALSAPAPFLAARSAPDRSSATPLATVASVLSESPAGAAVATARGSAQSAFDTATDTSAQGPRADAGDSDARPVVLASRGSPTADTAASSGADPSASPAAGTRGQLSSSTAVDAAVAGGVATKTEAQARSDSTANRVLASGGSPVKAAAASKQALAQLGQANSRTGAATAAQRLGDSLASGRPMAGSAALGAALARGVSPAAALARAAARDAMATAMLNAATVPQSAANQAAAALSEGRIGGQPGGAAMIAALAAGRNPAAALAAAQAAAAMRNTMQRASAIALTQNKQDAANLATGDTGRLGTATLAALARRLSPDAAAAAAARAEREKEDAVKRSQTPATDARGAALAEGTVPPGTTLVVRNGVPTLIPDHTETQLASASVAVAQGDSLAALAAGNLPDGLPPTREMSMAIVQRLRHGETLAEAINHAVAARPAASAPDTAGGTDQDTLNSGLATGRIDRDYLTRLAAGADLNIFMKTFGNALQRGLAPSNALPNANRNARAPHPDDEIARQ